MNLLITALPNFHKREMVMITAIKNMEIQNSLKSASNIRLGAEVRLNKLYLRTGYGYYGKAFKSSEDNANLDYNSLSFGAGFREQNFSIDFAYTNFNYSQKYFLYPVDLRMLIRQWLT